MSKIHITIDRLVLRGLDPGQRHAFVSGLKAELARSLTAPATRDVQAASLRPHSARVLRLGHVALDPGIAGARQLGNVVACRIAGGIQR